MESVDQKFNNLSIDEEPKITFNFNFNAAPYQPDSKRESSESRGEKLVYTAPKVNKKEEESEQNRAKVLSEARESKETVSIVFIGHVDAGKSTIGGHLLYLTGMVDKRTLEKYEKEAKERNRETWYYSWALDINPEERDKGKTVEVGRAYFNTQRKIYVLLDAPGHKAFVPNMISGVAQADVAILVISARIGEFETGFNKGGQTREHAQIAKISGVRYLLIVVNKMDDPTVNWSETRYNEIVAELFVYLKKIGWKSSEMYVMPISGYMGYNIKDPIPVDICPWYQNKPTFLEYLDNLSPINQDVEGLPMILVSDRYKDKGSVCVGKVISGCFSKNDIFILMPSKIEAKIANIMTMDEEEKTIGKIGENINIRLNGPNEQEIQPGSVLCTPTNLCSIGSVFDAQIIVIDCKSIIACGFKCIIHLHNVVDEVILTGIKREMDRKTQTWVKPKIKFVKQDSICIVRLTLSKPQCMAPHTDILQLSRFSLRDEGKTVAFGKIIKLIQ